MPHTGDVHPIDLLADEFWQTVQRRVEWVRAAAGGPVTVGTRRPSRQEMMREFLSMAPEERIELGQRRDISGVRKVLFDTLGDHALNLLPHIGVPMTSDEEELTS